MVNFDKESLREAVSENVYQLRKIRGLSQKNLSDEASMHRNSIGAIERGEKNPSLKAIEEIADALDVQPGMLLSPPDKVLEEMRSGRSRVPDLGTKGNTEWDSTNGSPSESGSEGLARYLEESKSRSVEEEDDGNLVEPQAASEMREILSGHLSKRGVADNRLAGKAEGEEGVILLPPYDWNLNRGEDVATLTIRGSGMEPGDTVWDGDTTWTTTFERVVASRYRKNALFFYRNLDGQPVRDVVVPLQRSRVEMLDSISPGDSLQKDDFLDHPNNTKDDGSRQSDGPRRWRELRDEYGFGVKVEDKRYYRGTTVVPVEKPNPRPDMAALKRKYWDDVYERHDGECNICGRDVRYDEEDDGVYGLLDHRVPVPYGGSDNKENLQLACQECNNIKKRLYKYDPNRYLSENLALAYPEEFERFFVQLDNEEATILRTLAQERDMPTRTFAGRLLGAATRMVADAGE